MMLKPFEAFYQLASAAKNYLYEKEIFKSVKVTPAVISIGNLSFGGTGKTPCIQFLANELSSEFKVAIVCRSYKARLKLPARVDLKNPKRAEIFGDEACLLQATLPQCQVWSGPQKYLTAKAAEADKPDLILVDDGFSHRQLRREFDLVLFDTSYLNQDYFRESLESLKRAHAVLLTKTQSASTDVIEGIRSRILKFAPHLERAIFLAKTETAVELPTSKKLFVFCGLAKPMSFRSAILDLGFTIAKFKQFADHFEYSEVAQAEILQEYLQLKKIDENLSLVTTEKDFVKLSNPELIKNIYVATHKMIVDEKQKVGLLENIRSSL